MYKYNTKEQPLELDSLPDFMKSTSVPQAKFHSAFPPLTTKVRVKSVMERAGFDVYKPPAHEQKTPLMGKRNFTAPNVMLPPSRLGKNIKGSGSTPSLNSNKRSFTNSYMQTTHSSPNILSREKSEPLDKATYVKNRLNLFTDPIEAKLPEINNESSELENLAVIPNIQIDSPISPQKKSGVPDFEQESLEIPPRKDIDEQYITSLNKDEEKRNPHQYLALLNPNQEKSIPTRESHQPDNYDDQFDTSVLHVRSASKSSNNSNDSLDSFDRKFEAEMDNDPLDQLTNMKSTIGIPEINIDDVESEIPSTIVPLEGKRLSTMATNDLNIYNLNSIPAEMSVIQERTFEDSELAIVPDIQLINNDDVLSNSPSIESTHTIVKNDILIENGFTKHSANVVDSPNLKMEQQNTQLPESQSEADSIYQKINQLQIQTKYPPGEGDCRKCHLPISENEKKIWSKDHQLSGQWHRKCFGCYSCGAKFSKGSSCYVFEDAPYCESHFHELNGSLCKACNTGVEGECMQNDLDEVFHFDCLRCGHCGKTVTGGDYFTFKNQILCEQDAQNMISELHSPTDEERLLKRRTRIMYL